MSDLNVVVGALCAWRENRGGGTVGMQSVLNVLENRAVERKTTIYEEATRRLQFSSMTALGDPQLGLWPGVADPLFARALVLASKADEASLEDITGGATNYYAVTLNDPPEWAAAMVPTVTIAGQRFYKTA